MQEKLSVIKSFYYYNPAEFQGMSWQCIVGICKPLHNPSSLSMKKKREKKNHLQNEHLYIKQK